MLNKEDSPTLMSAPSLALLARIPSPASSCLLISGTISTTSLRSCSIVSFKKLPSC